jgi:hypothetical protein
MVRPKIDVSGIRDFTRQLKMMDAGLGKTVRITLNSAAEIVVTRARPKIPKRTGAAAASLKVSSSQREARVAAGGRKAPYYPWLDFGGRTGPNESVVRPFFTEGRYIYPTVRENNAEIQQAMATGLSDLAQSAGLVITE